MDSLTKEDGQILTNQDDILKEQVNFYSDVYKKKIDFETNKADNFMQNVNIPKISEDRKNELDNDLTIDELTKSLHAMSNDSSPGSDGITYSFLKFFWSKIKNLVYESFKSGLERGEMSFTQRQGIITLLHKGKDLARDKLSNWRPISLTNTDYKILAKTFANRLSSVITDIISPDQVGFIKGRNISSVIRLIDDTIEYINSSKQSGILLAVDYKRAFDSISKEYMIYAFKTFGFGENFIKWIQLLLNNTESSINYLGWISESFKVECGVRQGCPFSPLAFIIGLELLALKIRSNVGTQGITLPVPRMSASVSMSLKIAMYADDITLFLRNILDFRIAMNIINNFSEFSNLYINENKSEALKIGTAEFQEENIGNIKFKEKLKILGIIFRNDLSASMNEENWSKKIDRIKEIIAMWTKRNLSISGKLVVVKTFLISQLVYILQSLALPEKVLNTINSILFRFIWKKKNTNTRAFEKVKRKTMCNSYDKGGITMINIVDLQNSFLMSWVTKVLSCNEINKNNVDCIPLYLLSKLGPDLIALKSLANNKLFIGSNKITSIFWKKALCVWNENKEKIDFMQTDNNINQREQVLWNNTKIMYRRKCLFFEDWAHSGINYLKDVKSNNRILTYDEICRRIGYKASRIFEYNAIYTALLSVEARSIEQRENINNFIINRIPSIKEFRINLSSSEIQPTANVFWERTFNVQILPSNWTISRLSTTEERLRLLHWKILHNIYPTRILLHKMGIADSNLCKECRVVDHIEHFFYHCHKIKKVWDACTKYIYKVINKQIILTQTDILLGYKVTEFKKKDIRFINHMILITKMVISKFR